MDKIEILILSKDRPLQLRDMIASIALVTPKDSYRIIICDNNSKQPEMLTLLNELGKEHTVIRNKENLLFEGLNPGLELIKGDYFIISDPDIILNKNMPSNWVDVMIETMEKASIPKVGVALNVNFDTLNLLTWRVSGCEDIHWRNKTEFYWIKEPCYWAAIDTTFAMYHRTTFRHWVDKLHFSQKAGGLYGSGIVMQDYAKQQCPIRIAGNYTAEHGGWYTNPKYYPDYLWYRDSCHHGMSSSILHSRVFIEMINEGKEPENIEMIKKSLPANFDVHHPKWNIPSLRNKYLSLVGINKA